MHFTEFSLQPTLIKDLSPQEYKDMGRSPLKSYVDYGQLMVSPQGGTTSVSVTELVLPGRDGFDFVLGRHYDSATARMDAFCLDFNVAVPLMLRNIGEGKELWDLVEEYKKTGGNISGWLDFALDVIRDYLLNQGDYAYSMGQGWRLNIPYIRAGSNALYLRLADGTMFSIYEMEFADVEYENMTRKLTFEQHEGADFTLIVHQIYQPFSYEVKKGNQSTPVIRASWQGAGYELILKDGTRYLLDELGRTMKLIDATGKNELNFNYRYSFPHLFLDNITDSMGRVLKFGYTGELFCPALTECGSKMILTGVKSVMTLMVCYQH